MWPWKVPEDQNPNSWKWKDCSINQSTLIHYIVPLFFICWVLFRWSISLGLYFNIAEIEEKKVMHPILVFCRTESIFICVFHHCGMTEPQVQIMWWKSGWPECLDLILDLFGCFNVSEHLPCGHDIRWAETEQTYWLPAACFQSVLKSDICSFRSRLHDGRPSGFFLWTTCPAWNLLL